VGLHPTIFEAAHRAAQHHRLGHHRRVLVGTTCRDLVSKLGRKTPTRASELMNIATKFASGQEAVEAIFRKDKQPQGR
jgi:predicted nucleotidyltransferase